MPRQQCVIPFNLNKTSKINLTFPKPIETTDSSISLKWFCSIREFSMEKKFSLMGSNIKILFSNGYQSVVEPRNYHKFSELDLILGEMFEKKRLKRDDVIEELIGFDDDEEEAKKKTKLAKFVFFPKKDEPTDAPAVATTEPPSSATEPPSSVNEERDAEKKKQKLAKFFMLPKKPETVPVATTDAPPIETNDGPPLSSDDPVIEEQNENEIEPANKEQATAPPPTIAPPPVVNEDPIVEQDEIVEEEKKKNFPGIYFFPKPQDKKDEADRTKPVFPIIFAFPERPKDKEAKEAQRQIENQQQKAIEDKSIAAAENKVDVIEGVAEIQENKNDGKPLAIENKSYVPTTKAIEYIEDDGLIEDEKVSANVVEDKNTIKSIEDKRHIGVPANEYTSIAVNNKKTVEDKNIGVPSNEIVPSDKNAIEYHILDEPQNKVAVNKPAAIESERIFRLEDKSVKPVEPQEDIIQEIDVKPANINEIVVYEPDKPEPPKQIIMDDVLTKDEPMPYVPEIIELTIEEKALSPIVDEPLTPIEEKGLAPTADINPNDGKDVPKDVPSKKDKLANFFFFFPKRKRKSEKTDLDSVYEKDAKKAKIKVELPSFNAVLPNNSLKINEPKIEDTKVVSLHAADSNEMEDFIVFEDLAEAFSVAPILPPNANKFITDGFNSIKLERKAGKFNVSFDKNFIRALKISKPLAKAMGFNQSEYILHETLADDSPTPNFFSHIGIFGYRNFNPIFFGDTMEEILAVLHVENDYNLFIHSSPMKPIELQLENDYTTELCLQLKDLDQNPICGDNASGHLILDFFRKPISGLFS